jgi:hypothetical protein
VYFKNKKIKKRKGKGKEHVILNSSPSSSHIHHHHCSSSSHIQTQQQLSTSNHHLQRTHCFFFLFLKPLNLTPTSTLKPLLILICILLMDEERKKIQTRDFCFNFSSINPPFFIFHPPFLQPVLFQFPGPFRSDFHHVQSQTYDPQHPHPRRLP